MSCPSPPPPPPPHLCPPATSAELENLTEATLLAELKVRFNRDVIYTYVGEILVTVNPFKWVPGPSLPPPSGVGQRVGSHPPLRAAPLVRVKAKFTVKNAVCQSLRRQHRAILTVNFGLTCTSGAALMGGSS